ncbi:MAG: hypothetical protein M3Y37_09580, partial [Chloroflexota bacterium]|nr:hypothetical protein [Chloroflexota bacterium]
SDVDVLVVPHPGAEVPARAKHVEAGLALDVSTIDRSELEPADRILGTYHLAGSLRSARSILYDPQGWLTNNQRMVEAGFDDPRWVRTRYEGAIRRIESNLRHLETAESLEARVIGWLFAAGITTHVLLVAGLRNPTVRSRYVATRSMLAELGHPEMYAPLIDLLDPPKCGPTWVGMYIDSLEIVFDRARHLRKTWFHFAPDISQSGRVGEIDAARELVRAGHHREAMFWIGVTAARCTLILNTDVDDSPGARHNKLLAELAYGFRIKHEDHVANRADELRSMIPRLRADAEALIADRQETIKRPHRFWRRGRNEIRELS